MAGLDIGLTVPVWLAEDDLGCIICQGLLAWPVTLPCGHSFCRDCLKDLWGAGRHWSCPTCREGSEQQLELRKNTLLQDLADKYSRAVGELEGGPGPTRSPGPSPRPARRTGLQKLNSRMLCLPPHAQCLTRATLHPRGPLNGPSVQPLT
ncbi:ring finger protein 135 [Rhinolophus ferrumequinum]|uniref:Ring finger protein 135 n=1 Tax=Rhinolophus ferrumequinum TaxID=59479 RepID=A0A7J7TGM5_RHIFE|nr:ring finger protein 135 [Rhinolophus ferrumequinum]